jgi:Cu/Ag efflux protein CusF
MKSFMKWVGAAAAVVLVAGAASAANTLAAGTVKSVDGEKKEFVLTDGGNKDWTVQIADDAVINRGSKEGKADLKAGDEVSVCYDKGLRTWTAHYILVKEGDAKNCQLIRGAFKGYDADKKQFTGTDKESKDWTYSLNDVKVRLNMQDSKIEDVKIGDHYLAVVDQADGKTVLKSLMVERSK